MKHVLPIILLIGGLAACTTTPPDNVISSMNYTQEAVDPACAYAAIRDLDGFSLVGPRKRYGQDAERFEARFNETLPVHTIIRRTDKGETGEVSVFVRLEKEPHPFERRKAKYAVRRADEAIYLSCTEDGRNYPSPDAIVITGEK